MILPGEHAPSHRHSSHALRVIIDAKGSYSVVDGEKTPMETGDVVLTPGWSWHGHGHDGDEPAYSFDGLDVPLTHLLEPMFFQEHPQKHAKIDRVVETSPFRFRRADIARKLDAARADNEGFHGPRVTLEAPTMPPIGLTVERLPSGQKTRAYRTTANTIFHVMDGAGESTVGDQRFSWKRGDTFVAPGWNAIGHHATSDAQWFAMSDEPLIRIRGLLSFRGEGVVLLRYKKILRLVVFHPPLEGEGRRNIRRSEISEPGWGELLCKVKEAHPTAIAHFICLGVDPPPQGRREFCRASVPNEAGVGRHAAFFSRSGFHWPSAARPFIRARWVKARWAAATFSVLPDQAFCGAACSARP